MHPKLTQSYRVLNIMDVSSACDSCPAEPLHFDIDFCYTFLIGERIFEKKYLTSHFILERY